MSDHQLGLFDEKDDVQVRFEKFHRDNPHVYEKLVALARQVQRSGFKKYSIWSLFGRLRWHYHFETHSDDPFKLSNDYTSRYSRLLMEKEPELAGFFHIKPLKYERRMWPKKPATSVKTTNQGDTDGIQRRSKHV